MFYSIEIWIAGGSPVFQIFRNWKQFGGIRSEFVCWRDSEQFALSTIKFLEGN